MPIAISAEQRALQASIRDWAQRAGTLAMVRGLEDLAETLRAGIPLQQKFTVRTFRVRFNPPDYAPADIRLIRESLFMSQAVFAAFLGVDAGTVRSWEQGLRTPSGIARRFLQEVEAEPKHWRKRIAAAGKVEKFPRKPTHVAR